MNNKFAVINGAYGGIGFAIAKKLAQSGYSLILLGRDRAKLQHSQCQIESFLHVSAHIICYEVDVKNNESMTKAALYAMQNNYDIDVLINAVGIVPIGNIHDVTENHWENTIQTSLMGAIRFVTNFSPVMIKKRSGKIILINGVLSRQPEPSFIISSTITGAINNFAKALSRDMGKYNIRVNTINPGATSTPLWDGVVKGLAHTYQLPEETITAQARSQVPLGRIAEVDDIANAVNFLCSENANFINGAFLTIDGGASVAY